MPIAAKCTCGKSPYYCIGGEGCRWEKGISLEEFFVKNDCTDDERKKLKAVLFAIRHSEIDFQMLENIVKKYSHLL